MKRREFLAAAAAAPLLAQPARPAGLFPCVHQVSSNTFDFKTAMEGYAKGGIRAVEVVLAKAREFADKESPATARRLLDDLGLKVVSLSNHTGAIEANPNRAKNLDDLKAKCELGQRLGGDRLVHFSSLTAKPAEDDYKHAAANFHEAAEVCAAYNVALMLEFSKFATLPNSLASAIAIARAADHANARVMLDTYHFWIGSSKMEDLELLSDGELAHVHFEDTPREPVRELLEQRHRMLPGEGVAPLKRIVEVLKQKKYAGPLSVELFDPSFQSMAPSQLATKVRAALEPLLA